MIALLTPQSYEVKVTNRSIGNGTVYSIDNVVENITTKFHLLDAALLPAPASYNKVLRDGGTETWYSR